MALFDWLRRLFGREQSSDAGVYPATMAAPPVAGDDMHDHSGGDGGWGDGATGGNGAGGGNGDGG
jgi:hypothetical protein